MNMFKKTKFKDLLSDLNTVVFITFPDTIKEVSEIAKEVATEYAESTRVVRIAGEKNQELCEALQVKESMMILYKDGKQKMRCSTSKGKEMLDCLIMYAL